MVRVLSVHNFESQTIETCEDPVAVTTAPPDRLLVALSHHMIEVHDLSSERKPVFSFPTVDQVCSLVHCVTGNYVATMEIKVGRENREVVYTRIYANWDQPELLSSSQPAAMRARIAGRVTPSSSQTGGETLEMIELPIRFPNTSAIACCQATGNVIVGCGKTLCLFQLVSRLHDISRQRFFDFELWPVTLELNFAPTHLSIVENIVAAMDTHSQSLHVFKINKGVSHRSGQSSTYSGSPLRTNSAASAASSEKKSLSLIDQEAIDIDQFVTEPESYSRDSRIQVVELSSVKMNNLSCDLRPSPFKPSYMVSMGVAIKEMPTNEPWAEQMTTMVESLLQLEVEDCNQDMLHSLILRPLYLKSNSEDSDNKSGVNIVGNSHTEWSCPRLRSIHYNRLVGLDCLICTQQEGFLYHFSVGNFDTVNVGECITVYSFTSPLHHICLEAGLLHALTTSGLETYTMRSTHAVHVDENQVCPPIDDPVCLIGLRPFIGIVGLLLTEFHLIILASSEARSVNWTIYSLKLPSPEQLYHDMVSIATTYKDSTPSMYRQLLGEAHTVIRTATQFASTPVSSVKVTSEAKEMFKQSCALLAQSHLTSDKEIDWEIGSKYISMSGMSPDEYLNWLGVGDNQGNFDLKQLLGMSYYLMKCLGQWPERIPHSIMTALADQLEPVQLADLLLKSPALVSCASDSVRQRLLNRTEPECCLASELLARDPGKALQLLPNDRETNDKLVKILTQNHMLLFDTMRIHNSQVVDDGNKMKLMTFSELSVLLMQEKPHQLASCLASLVTRKMDLEHILQIFMTYLPSRIGLAGASASGGIVLQLFLEEALLFGREKPDTLQSPIQDALKILMRSYLSDVKCQCNKDYNLDKLNIEELPKFLNELPINQSESNPSTKKLQWLLYKKWLDTKALSELNQFVYDFLPDCLTLQVLAQPPDAAIQLLLNNCHNAVVLYSKEMIKENSDWEMLLKLLKDHSNKDIENSTYAFILKELLIWLSENGKLCNILSQDDYTEEEYKEHVLTCQQVRHAEHIHCMIRATGEYLLTSLNL
ncbi:BLOC-2 complex member HPS3 isoform X2 [Lycorma delicatula]|uniref:BLOC-2 complex member HPS3 isoform X2 n=1 Tax=Lycorma delicatula TaxID=130591 RepID=UPI003F516E12